MRKPPQDRVSRQLAVGVAIALFATADGAAAQQAGTSPPAQPSNSGQGTSGAAQAGDGTAQSTAPSSAIEDVVVTARRSSEKEQNVPIAITTVTAQRLTDLSVRDIVDIQKVTPGLYIGSQPNGGRARITIRGQSEADSRLTTDGSVGVYVDGVNYARDYGLRSSLVDIAQIEVLKGPQGTLFGKNTTGGALNVTTQHPLYDWGGYVDLVYGNYNNAQALAVLNAPIVADKLALRLVGQVISRDGYGTSADGRDAGDDHVWTARALLRADPVDNVHLLLSADYVKQRNNGTATIITNDSMLQNGNSATGSLGSIAAQLGLNPQSAADRLTAYNAWLQYYNAYRNGAYTSYFGTAAANGREPLTDNVDHWGLSANLAIDFGQVTIRSITAYRHLTRYGVQDLDSTPFNLQDAVQGLLEQNFSQEFQISAIDGVGFDWQVGLFYNRETGTEYTQTDTLTYVNVNRSVITDGDVENTSKAAYAQAVYNLTHKLRVTGGIRYTDDYRGLVSHNRIDPTLAEPPLLAFAPGKCNLLTPALGGPTFPNCSYAASVSFNRPTWLASIDWRPISDALVYGTVSRGYRAGGFTLTGSATVQPSVAALNAAFAPFAPETVTNYEVGVKSDPVPGKLRVNIAAYYQDYTNIQKQIRDVVNGININLIRNAASATIYGGEVEVTAAPTNALTLTGAAAYNHARYNSFFARDTAGNLLDFTAQPFSTPEWTYNLGAAYRIPVATGAIRLDANFAWTGTVNLAPGQPGVALSVYDPGSVTQKGYGLLDARVSWHLDGPNLDLALFGRNLTDRHYFTAAQNGQSAGYNIAYAGAPRTFGIQARKTF